MALVQQETASARFDVIVIGVGSMGASACYYLAKKGYRVLGLEQFDIPHEQGSHSGQSRIIRKAYFESPDYVPLLERAYQNWAALEKESGEQLYYPTGLLYAGNPDHELIKGLKLAASLYKVPVETIRGETVRKRFAPFKFPPAFEILYEPDAGFLQPEKAISVYAQLAAIHGAKINTQEKLLQWKKEGDEIIVETTKNSYRCQKLVLTAGAWTGKLIAGLGERIKVTRQMLGWFEPVKPSAFLINHFPCWMIAGDEGPGVYYGFPWLPATEFGPPGGLKLAYHYRGHSTDPDNVDRLVKPGEEKYLAAALDRYFHGEFKPMQAAKTCLYSNTPDDNFIIDLLPGYENRVAIACGFSGHGFKFSSVVGELLTELIDEGKTHLPIDFLKMNRF